MTKSIFLLFQSSVYTVNKVNVENKGAGNGSEIEHLCYRTMETSYIPGLSHLAKGNTWHCHLKYTAPCMTSMPFCPMQTNMYKHCKQARALTSTTTVSFLNIKSKENNIRVEYVTNCEERLYPLKEFLKC